MALVVRNAVKGDIRVIADFAVRLFAQHLAYDAKRFADIGDLEGAVRYYASRIDAETAMILVAELDETLVGFAYLEYEALDYAMLLEKAAWLHDLYVSAEARGSGAGKLLIEAATEAATQLGAEKLILTVASKNGVAHQFFQHLGFRGTMVEMTLSLADSDGA